MAALPHSSRADLDAVIDALAAPARREILRLVWDEELAAGDIAAAFALAGPTISEHLAVLRDSGLVSMRVDGNFRRYRARTDRLVGLHRVVFGDSARWTPADDIPERALAQSYTGRAVTAQVDLECEPEAAFRGFTEPDLFSRWMGVPVSIVDGRLAMTLEWGTEIRGVFEYVDAPRFIAMRWDFDDNNVPVPGGEMQAYFHVRPNELGGTRVEVHQLADAAAHAEFLEVAWTLVLGRAKQGLVAAIDSTTPPRHTAPRPKLRGTRRVR